eukprot:m.112097 g.112097  ORF g.112097 m.112097 type:complete len:60 (+) comp12776_c4_seq2:257-436(+)
MNVNYPLVVKTDLNEEMLVECTESAQTAIEKHSNSNEVRNLVVAVMFFLMWTVFSSDLI